MNLVVLILIFAGIFAIFDGIRKLNNNILAQTEELKKISKQLTRNNQT